MENYPIMSIMVYLERNDHRVKDCISMLELKSFFLNTLPFDVVQNCGTFVIYVSWTISTFSFCELGRSHVLFLYTGVAPFSYLNKILHYFSKEKSSVKSQIMLLLRIFLFTPLNWCMLPRAYLLKLQRCCYYFFIYLIVNALVATYPVNWDCCFLW